MARVVNLLTGNTVSAFPEVAAAAQPPTLRIGDVAFYRQPPVNAWGDIRAGDTDAPLRTELQFLEGLGYAVARDNGQWYVDLVAKERLYGHNGLFVAGPAEGDQERKMAELARMFATDVLPAYAAMIAGVSQTLPRSTFQGIVAREQARDIAAGIRELQMLIQPTEGQEEEERNTNSNASSVSSEESNTNSNVSSVSSVGSVRTA